MPEEAGGGGAVSEGQLGSGVQIVGVAAAAAAAAGTAVASSAAGSS